MKPLPFAWAVKYVHHGEERKFITLERSRADDYAATHHGTIHGLYTLDQFETPTEKAMPENP